MKKFLSLVAILVTLGACTNIQEKKVLPEPVMTINEVANVEYQLENIFPNQGLTLGFDNENRIFGYSGLNRFFGKTEIENGNIKVDPLASTRMGGAKEALIREDQYLSLLKSMTKIQIENGKLILTNDKGEQLIFSTNTTK